MTLIIAAGRNVKLMITLNLFLIALKKILEINGTYGYLKQPTAKYISWKVTLFLFIREWVRDGGYSEQK